MVRSENPHLQEPSELNKAVNYRILHVDDTLDDVYPIWKGRAIPRLDMRLDRQVSGPDDKQLACPSPLHARHDCFRVRLPEHS